MPWEAEHLSVWFGPTEVGAPDPIGAPILSTIEGARKQLLLATQQLEHEDVLDALLAAKARKVDVRVLLERDYLSESRAVEDPREPSGDNERNRVVLSTLLRARIPVRVDRTRRLQHTNFIVADAGRSGAHAVFGSANFTPTGLHKNLNHVVSVRDEEVAAAFAQEFAANWEDAPGSPHPAKPLEKEIDGVRVRVVFGPDHGPEMEVMKQIIKARESVDFSVFTFSGTSGIDDALVNARALGVRIRGVIDGRQGSARWAATPLLKDSGVELYLSTHSNKVRKLHHKLVVSDRRVVILGTFNFTRPAARLNDEALFVFGHRGELSSPARELVDYASAEIDRVITLNARPA